MNKDPQVSPREFSESIQELRDEMRRDIRGLASTMDRRPQAKSGTSTLAVAASGLVSLFVGAAGMSLYDSKTQAAADAEVPQANVQAELQAVMVPYTQQLEQMTKALVVAERAATESSSTHRLLLDQLAESVTSLQKSAEVQNTTLQEQVGLLADELAGKLSPVPATNDEATVAARQPIPSKETAPVQPANAEVDAANSTDQAEDRPSVPAPSDAERGELVINNPSDYDLNLVVNGEPLEIKSRGVTTIAVTIGAVKTQIANIPITARSWDNWETVDGVKRLTIQVESGDGTYSLR